MILAEKIALLRRQTGWSQEELANQLNVSRQAVSKWESGASIPDLDKVLKLSALFEVTTDYLLKDEQEQPDAAVPVPQEEQSSEPCRTISLDEANEYLATVQAGCGKLAAGVGLCILSPIPLLLLGAWSDGTLNEDRMAGIGVVLLLVLVALGVLFILPAAFRLEKFEYLEKEEIDLAYGVPPQHDAGSGALRAGRGAASGVRCAGGPGFLGRSNGRAAAGYRGRCGAAFDPRRDDAGRLRQAAANRRIYSP